MPKFTYKNEKWESFKEFLMIVFIFFLIFGFAIGSSFLIINSVPSTRNCPCNCLERGNS